VLERAALTWLSPTGSDFTVIVARDRRRATGGPNEMPPNRNSTAPAGRVHRRLPPEP
jgi:hypothetical protein